MKHYVDNNLLIVSEDEYSIYYWNVVKNKHEAVINKRGLDLNNYKRYLNNLKQFDEFIDAANYVKEMLIFE